MKVTAVMLVKNEADIVGYTLAHLLAEGVDEIIVADNMSSDETRDILDLYADKYPVIWFEDTDPGFRQGDKMTALAEKAAFRGADWVVCCDADELWTGLDMLRTIPADVVEAAMRTYLPHHTDDLEEPNPYRRIVNRRHGFEPWPKVAFRPVDGIQVHIGNHNVSHPGRRVKALQVDHFMWRTRAQMERKARQGKAALEAGGINARHGVHWRAIGALTDVELDAYWEQLTTEPGLIHDPAGYKGDQL